MSILLIRHGETASNAARVVQTPQTPLSERGMAQARLLAERLSNAPITRIIASDMARARMTAESLRASTGAPLELDALLRERNFGDHRGVAYADLDVDIFAPEHAPPNGEDWNTFHARVDRAWERVAGLAAGERGDLAVVTHGLVCHSVVTRKVELPAAIAEASETGTSPDRAGAAPWLLRFGNTAVTILAGSPPWGVSLLACTAHLDAAREDDADAPTGI